MPTATPLLDTVRAPADLRQLKPQQLRQVADELRAETIDAVSVTGGHLGAGVGCARRPLRTQSSDLGFDTWSVTVYARAAAREPALGRRRLTLRPSGS